MNKKRLNIQTEQFLTPELMADPRVSAFINSVKDTYEAFEQEIEFSYRSGLFSEEKLMFALEERGDCVWEFHVESGMMILSKEFMNLLGLSEPELKCPFHVWCEKVHPEDRHIIETNSVQYGQNAIVKHELEYRVRHKDGHYVWIQDNGKIVNYTTGGKPSRLIGTYRDISAKKRTEEELFKLSLMARANKNAVLFSGPDGMITWVNEMFTQLTGYTPDEAIGKSPLQLLAGPLSDPKAVEMVASGFYKGEVVETSIIHYRKDGSWYWGHSNSQPYFDKNGKVSLYFSVIDDITKKKEQEDQLNILSRIAEDNINAVVIANASANITWVNKSYVFMTGYSPEETIGHNVSHLFKGPDTNRFSIQNFSDQISWGESFQGEVMNYKKDGTVLWQRMQCQPIKNAKGNVSGYFLLLENINNEKKAQQMLLVSELRLNKTLQLLGDNVWEHDFRTGKTKFYDDNTQFQGLPFSEYDNMEKLWWDAIHHEDKGVLEENKQAYLAGLIDSHNMEYRIQKKDGSIRWLLDRGIVIEKDDDGLPLRVIGTQTDITEVKETQKALREEESKFRSLAESVPGVIYKYQYKLDGSEGFVYIGADAEKKIGVTEAELRNFYGIIHPDDIERERALSKLAIITKKPFHFEGRFLIPGKPLIWLSISSTFSDQTEDETLYTTGIITNITKEKEAEQAVQIREEKYRNIITNMNLGLLEVDLEDRIQFVNQSFCDMSGYLPEELYGKIASELFVSGETIEVMEKRNESRKQGISEAYEISVKNKKGEERWWLISGAPRYTDKGELVGSIGIHLDITSQKNIEKELLSAREEALQSSRAKEMFLANMSHEIRTPMNAIVGLSRQLQKTELNDRQHVFLDTINKAADHLMVIINDILDISKIEAGQLKLEKINFRAQDLLSRTIQVMMHRAEEKGLSISTIADENIPDVLCGDPHRLNQILLNLVSNAIKFTESGFVRIQCAKEGEKNGLPLIRFTVADSGIGMNEDFKDKIFSKFMQEDSSVTRKYGGSGLGLSIIRELVELMDGEIVVESKKNEGTTISVLIPLETAEGGIVISPESQTVLNSTVIRGKKILLAEDNEMNRLVATTVLEPYGAFIKEAENGEEAVRALNKEDFDLVLMDMQMPVMNGLEATMMIRTQISKDIPILALTANALKGERDRCFKVGMNDFIAKPFEEKDLISKISEWLHRSNRKVSTVQAKQLYDLSKLYEVGRGSQEFVNKMLRIFMAQGPQAASTINNSYQKGDFEKVRAEAHRIKPSIDNLGIHTLQKEVREIEKLAQLQQPSERLEQLVENMGRTITEVVDLFSLQEL